MRRRSTSTIGLSAVLINLFGHAAVAGTVDELRRSGEAGPIEEIVVTARYREEDQQDIPISISSFDADQIEDAGIRDINDFAQLTPGAVVQQGFFAGDHPIIVFRGVSLLGGTAPTVGITVDGINLPAGEPLRNRMFDVERIEVLKGPQGAAYGRDTIGGVINLITRQPADQLGGYVSLSSGSADERSASAALSGPVVRDRLYYRVSANHQELNGFFENFSGSDQDHRTEQAVRGQLVWHPGDRTDVRLIGGWTDHDGGYNAAFFSHDDDTYIDDVGGRFPSEAPGFNRRENRDVAVKVEHDFGFAELTSISQYQDIDLDLLLDADFGLIRLGGGLGVPAITTAVNQAAEQDDEIFSQELRLVSNSAERFRWILGAYFEDSDREYSQTATLEFIPPLGSVAASSSTRFGRTVLAGYGSLDFDITDNLVFSAAIRRTHDENSVDPVSPVDAPESEKTAKVTTSTASLSYHFTDDIMGFATYSEGFRSGGFDLNTLVWYQPEETTNYEVGVKSGWFDGRLLANASVYFIEYTDQQVTRIVPLPSGQIVGTTVNLGESEYQGFELELIAQPMPRLDITLAFNVTDSEIIEGTFPESAGNEIPYTAETRSTLAAQYVWPLAGQWSLLTRAQVVRQGEQAWGERGVLSQDPYTLVSLRAELAGEHWSIAGSVNNLFDEEFNDQLFPNLTPGFHATYPGLPRRGLVEVRYTF